MPEQNDKIIIAAFVGGVVFMLTYMVLNAAFPIPEFEVTQNCEVEK